MWLGLRACRGGGMEVGWGARQRLGSHGSWVMEGGRAASQELCSATLSDSTVSWPWGEWGELTGGKAVTRGSYISGRQFGAVYPMRVNSRCSAIYQSFQARVRLRGERLARIPFWTTEPPIKPQQIIHANGGGVRRWWGFAMQENMHQQIYLPLFAASPRWRQSESNLFTRPFHNVPLNYFTNQGHGTGYCLEDKSINDIIITGGKKKKERKRDSVIRNHVVFPRRRTRARDSIKSTSLSRGNANREQFYRCLHSASDLLSPLLFWTTVYLHLRERPDGKSRAIKIWETRAPLHHETPRLETCFAVEAGMSS